MPIAKKIPEETTAKYSGQVVNEDNEPIALADLEVVQLTVYDRQTQSILRHTEDVRNKKRVSIDANGALVWNIRPFETRVVNTDLLFGKTEKHVGLFEFAWASEDVVTLTDPFATVSGSSLVTITHAAHGLAVDDHVVFLNAEPVGGLDLDGLYIVSEVIDASSFKVKHRFEAGSTDTGGGSPTAYLNPRAAKHEYTFPVVRLDPT